MPRSLLSRVSPPGCPRNLCAREMSFPMSWGFVMRNSLAMYPNFLGHVAASSSANLRSRSQTQVMSSQLPVHPFPVFTSIVRSVWLTLPCDRTGTETSTTLAPPCCDIHDLLGFKEQATLPFFKLAQKKYLSTQTSHRMCVSANIAMIPHTIFSIPG